jgi:hypothetical protein
MCYTFDGAKYDRIFLITCYKNNKLNCQVVISYHHRNSLKSMFIINGIIHILMLLTITMFLLIGSIDHK